MAWAETRRNWIAPVLLAVLLRGAGPALWAQSARLAAAPEAGPNPNAGPPPANETTEASGSIAGRLTDLHSGPLAGAAVVVRNTATGAETRTTTAKNGTYRLIGLASGEYTLDAESPQLGHGRLESIVVSAGHEARVQAAMAFEPAAAQPVEIAAKPPAEPPSRPVASVSPAPPTPVARSAPPSPPGPPLNSPEIAPPPLTLLQEWTELRRRAEEQTREKPAPQAALLAGTLAPETPLGLPLRARALSPPPPPKPTTSAPVLVAALPSRPLLTLTLAGHPAPASAASGALNIASSAGVELAMSAALASALEAALQLAQPAAPRVQAVAAQPDPAKQPVTTATSAAELQSLPAAGRRWQDFVLDTPAASTAAGGTPQASLRGAGQEPVETTIDGVSTRMAFGGQGSAGPQSRGPEATGQGGSGQNAMGQAWAGGRGSPIAEAAIREVQTAAGNAQVESSRAAGGQVAIETARGSNGLHGQGFLFDRDNAWGAQNPFTQWITETGSTEPLAPYNTTPFPAFDNFQYSSGQNGTPQSYTPPDREIVWGVGAGSQIRRDKLFWFAALDSYRRNHPGLAMVKHPYVWQIPGNCQPYSPCIPTLTGFFATPTDDELRVLCARLELIAPGQTGQPEACTNPLAQALVPYSNLLKSLDGLLGPSSRTEAQWVGFGRIDWQAAERHRFTLEGIGAHWNAPGGGLTQVSENYGSNSFGSSRAGEQLLLARWEAFLTPNLLAVFQGSAGRTILSAHAEVPSPFERTFLGPNSYGQLPQIVVDNRYGFTIGNPSRFGAGSYPDERILEGRESVDWVRGNLLVKSGFELSHNYDATSLLRNRTGTYTYSSVENFASDALVFASFGLAGQFDPDNQHNCDQTGKVWRDSGGVLRGLGALPCYAYYSQLIGPTNWNLSTSDWAGFSTVQWQPSKLLVVSGGLRWEREQLPPPLASLNNPELPLTQRLPSLGNDWGPRFSLALGSLESHWPVLRLGLGMYFGRTENATIETALTQTGSPGGDRYFFLRPTDNLNAGGAPPFPYVLRGQPGSVVKPGAVEFAPAFRNPEVHQAVAAVEEELPGHVEVTAAALMSLGRRLPISIDTNFDPAINPGSITYAVVDGAGAGPIKTPRITVPFYASWPSPTSPTGFAGRLNPDYQQITQIMSRANSTYEAAMLKLVRYGRRGLSLHAHYTYAHAMDWNPNESTTVAGSDVLDPADFSQEYGVSNLDVRHSAAAMVIYEAPWKLRNLAGKLANGWMVSGIGQFRGGLPYTMRTAGSLAREFDTANGEAIVALGPGMNGSGGDNRVYGVGRNTYRYPAAWKADLRLGKKFNLGQMRELELLVESFNLFNHQNVTELESTGYSIEPGDVTGNFPTLNFLSGLKANTTAFGQPLNINATNFYRERQIQVGVRVRF